METPEEKKKENTLLQMIEQMAEATTKKSENASTQLSVFSEGLQHSATTPLKSIIAPSDPFIEETQKTLQNRYKILQEWKTPEGNIQYVQDHLLGRKVILKTFQLSEATFLENASESLGSMTNIFLQEASITAMLEHPHILPLYEVQYLDTNRIQFSLRLISGKSLNEILLKKQGLAEPSCLKDSEPLLDWLIKICDALQYAHSRGVIHQDLKSENIILGDFGEVYIINWGHAKRLSVAEREASDSLQKCIQPDILALGAILQECFSEKGSVKKKIPPEIQAIIQRATCLSNPYPSVQALSEDIQRYLKNVPISAKEYHLLEIVWKWANRHRKIVLTGLFGAFLFLICGTYFKLKSWKQAQQQEQESYRHYEKLLQDAQNATKEAHSLEATETKNEKESRDQQIQCYLRVLTLLNKARSIKSSGAHAQVSSLEKEKLTISKQLLSHALQDENYQVALYVAQEIQSLSNLSASEKKEYLREVREKKNFTLTQHLQSLESWIKRFKSENDPRLQIKERETEDFIFEILPMKEPEILDRLLALLEEGTLFYLQDISERQKHLDAFYPYIPIILGRMKNARAVLSLRNCFQQIEQKCQTSAGMEINRVYYLSEMANALCLLNDLESLPSVEKLLEDPKIGKMAQSFTENAYRKLKNSTNSPRRK